MGRNIFLITGISCLTTTEGEGQRILFNMVGSDGQKSPAACTFTAGVYDESEGSDMFAKIHNFSWGDYLMSDTKIFPMFSEAERRNDYRLVQICAEPSEEEGVISVDVIFGPQHVVDPLEGLRKSAAYTARGIWWESHTSSPGRGRLG